MNPLRKMARTLCAFLALSVTFVSFPGAAQAAMVGTQGVIAHEQATFDRAQLLAALDRADVQQQLTALGVDLQQAKARVAAMTDDEVKALNGKVHDLPAGGDDLLGVLLVIFIILLITDIAGLTNVFPFVNHHR